ncbi:hypothetical protein Rs2_00913 [Raphanus sativus]|nr:hypothetical protein Rs2_51023 [Raphanus sativus]KAJ4915363.1 hypothetical protein Rs2_00913 [Raphanus sativus]
MVKIGGSDCNRKKEPKQERTSINTGSEERRSCSVHVMYHGDKETSQATESKTSECHTRPPGVKAAKAAKARGKKPEGKDLDGYQKMWSIRKEDMAMKEKLYKMSLLDNLIAKKDTLSESEEGLKDKLIAELYSA